MSLAPPPGAWEPPQQPQGPPPGYQQPWYPPPGAPRKGGGPSWTILGITGLIVVAIVVVPVISSSDEKFEQLGRRSGNATLEDFAVLSAQYGGAYVVAIPTYVPADRYLNETVNYSTSVVGAACDAVGS